MASAWGSAFGSAWGAAWGLSGATPTLPTPPTPVPEQASNWQGLKHPQSRKPTKEEERRQRIALGIIEDEIEAADDAVRAGVAAQEAVAIGLQNDLDIAESLEMQRMAEAAYVELYRESYRQEYRAEILKQYREEVATYRFEMKRRAALLLLLS